MMMWKTPSQGRSYMKLPLATAIVLASIAGCSTTGKPIAEMSAARTSLMAAEGEDTRRYAPVAMDRAKEKLKRAEAAIAAQDFEEARRLAEEAQADAELAQAEASKFEAEKAVKELEDSIRVLREEITRARSL